MGYYDDPTCKERGIDYDLSAALEFNEGQGYVEADIEEVLACIQGKRDGDSWHWFLRLRDGRFVYAEGWCDYTGWDCKSSMESTIVDGGEPIPVFMGLLMQRIIEPNSPASELILQLRGEKAKTWREEMDKEFGLA